MSNLRRIAIATIAGALLGVLCIIGVGSRIDGGYSNMIYLLAVWYNRVIMGLMIGFAGTVTIIHSEKEKNYLNTIVRGLILGLIVSSATLLLSESIFDLMGWFAGIIYGPIIDTVATTTEK
ncbi:hypothetical protein EU527_13320 [Candidatus Thorarchaeota archaeon]|nr:MAG: hypothetical protein EU527_13320 [Candidatus Thorarchaeota archaeon]